MLFSPLVIVFMPSDDYKSSICYLTDFLLLYMRMITVHCLQNPPQTQNSCLKRNLPDHIHILEKISGAVWRVYITWLD